MSEELLNQDATNEVSSEPQSIAATESTQPEAKAQDGVDNKQEQPQSKEPPFHEHPRFRELVEQKNQFADRAKSFESQIRALQEQVQRSQQVQAPKPEDKMIARLKSIDPEFGEYMEQLKNSMEKTQAELPQYREWKQNSELEAIRNQAYSTINSLHESNKVPKEWQGKYQAEIEAIVSKDPNIRVNDLPAVYKQVHESYTKLFDSMRRQERESYLKTKGLDTKAPTVPLKGAPAPAAKSKSEWTGDYDSDQAALKAKIIANIRANKNA